MYRRTSGTRKGKPPRLSHAASLVNPLSRSRKAASDIRSPRQVQASNSHQNKETHERRRKTTNKQTKRGSPRPLCSGTGCLNGGQRQRHVVKSKAPRRLLSATTVQQHKTPPRICSAEQRPPFSSLTTRLTTHCQVSTAKCVAVIIAPRVWRDCSEGQSFPKRTETRSAWVPPCLAPFFFPYQGCRTLFLNPHSRVLSFRLITRLT